MIRELRSTGATLEEVDVVCHLLLTMPSEYDTIVTALETLSKEDLSIAFVKNRLLDEESKRKSLGLKRNTKYEMQSSTAFSSMSGKGTSRSGKNYYTSSRTNKSNNFIFRCHNCGKPGHKRSECRSKPKETHVNMASNGKSQQTETDFCFAAMTAIEKENETQFFLDSGASDHMVCSKENLLDIQELEQPVVINVAKSKVTLTATHVGELKVSADVNGKENNLFIKRVLFVPALSNNLLSVRRLEIIGYDVTFKEGKGIISRNGHIAAVAYRGGASQLYSLKLKTRNVTANLCSTDNVNLWHQRLGHISSDKLMKLQGQVDGMEVEVKMSTELCDVCIRGKQTKQPHKQQRRRAKRPLELIHSDLFGPINPMSHDGKRYMLTFIDDFTHFTAAYPLESKSEVLKYFKIFEAMAVAHFNLRISRFRCDNGREYVSNEIKGFFEEKGIQFEFTIRYTPEQNGVAERMNRTIIEKARCMMINSKLGKTLWTEAVMTAVYLINRSPTSALEQKIPAALWYNEIPNLGKLKVFGCVAFLKIPKEIVVGKFTSRSKLCYFVGYCKNGYKLWCPEERRIVSGRDVIFDEKRFQFEGLSSEHWLNDDKDQLNGNEDEEYKSEGTEGKEENRIETESDAVNNESVKANEETHTEQSLEEEQDIIDIPRRSSRIRTTPKYFQDYAVFALSAESYVDDVPICYEDIKSRDDQHFWEQAVQEEISSIITNDTWELVPLPPKKRAIDSKWVFKIKRNLDGSIDRYKARLVIKGCAQRKGYDYDETYAPVARLTTLRVLISLIIKEDLKTCQLDVKNAFLHGTLEEEIYMKLPPGCNTSSQEEKVCKLKKALYGLKQAPRAWNGTFDAFVRQLNFEPSNSDRCLYIHSSKSSRLFLLVYVDDIVIAGSDEQKIQEVKKALEARFRMKDLGELHSFLGINIVKTEDGIFLSQENYLRELLNRFDMETCNPIATPMEMKIDLSSEDDIEDESRPYRELIGCLMYVTTTTRPDLCAAVNFYSRYQRCQNETLWKGLKRVLRYIKGTLNLGLFYCKRKQEPISLYVDTDFGSELDRKSTSGYLVQTWGNTVHWGTKRQTSVSLSSTEAEYIALATGTAELMWIKGLMKDFGFLQSQPLKVYEDNQSCIRLLHKWEHKRLKHVDVKYNFTRDLTEKKIIEVLFISTEDQIADIFTKPLPKGQFIKLRRKLGLCEFDSRWR